MYNWCNDLDRKRFKIQPPPANYLRLYLPFVNAAVVVPFDTAGDDIYELLYLLARGVDMHETEPSKLINITGKPIIYDHST